MRIYAYVSFVALACLCVPLGTPADASPVTFSFSGEVTALEEDWPLEPPIEIGAPFSGSFSYDPELAVDIDPDPTEGEFHLAASILGQAGGMDFQIIPGSQVIVQNRETVDSFRLLGDGSGNGWMDGEFYFELSGGDPDAFPSDALPSAIDFADFERAPFYYGCFSPFTLDTYYGIGGLITSVSIVPEPTSIMLLAAGGTLLCIRRRWAL